MNFLVDKIIADYTAKLGLQDVSIGSAWASVVNDVARGWVALSTIQIPAQLIAASLATPYS